MTVKPGRDEGGVCESEHLVLGVTRDTRGVIEQEVRFYGIDLLRGDENNTDLAERLGTVEREFFVVPLGGEARSVFDA